LDPLGGKTKIKKMPFRSFLKAFTQAISANWSFTARNIIDTGNTSRSYATTAYLRADAAAAAVTHGIIVGTSTQAVDISDYHIVSPIAHGSGAGNLLYQACVVSDVTVSGQNAYLTITRNFNNNTPNTVTIEECGIACNLSSGSYFFQISRDLTGGYSIPAAKTLFR
jgi:hypothetical protein